MNLKKAAIICSVVFLAVAAFLLRIIPYFIIQPGNMVGGPDVWYYIRLIDNLQATGLENYYDVLISYGALYSSAARALSFPLICAIMGMLFGVSSQPELISIVSWVPPIFGALCVPIMYALGRYARDVKTGMLAAAFTAIIGGEFFARTLYSYVDHHCAEIFAALLFCAAYVICMLWIRRTLTGRPVKEQIWKGALMALPAGLSWYIALDTSITLLYFGLFAAAFTIIQIVVDIIKRRPVWYLVVLNVVTVGFSAILLACRGQLERVFWQIVSCIPGVGSGISGCIIPIDSSSGSMSVLEVAPWTFTQAFNAFNIGLILAAIGLVLLIVRYVKKQQPEDLFFIVWSLGMFVSTTWHARWEYFLGANIALLCAIAIGEILNRAKNSTGTKIFIGFITCAFLVCSLTGAVAYAENYSKNTVVSDDWLEALEWVNNNTEPEPVNILIHNLAEYPDGMYSVLSWGDYGYQIADITHRAVVTNAGWGRSQKVAQIFLCGVEDIAAELCSEYNVKYVIVDDLMARSQNLLNQWAKIDVPFSETETLIGKMYYGSELERFVLRFTSSGGKVKIFELC